HRQTVPPVITPLSLHDALPISSEVKAAITGSGRADKKQVTTMVTRILGLEAPPKPADAADALAIAICHSWRGALSAQSTPGQERSEEHTSELQSRFDLVCRLLL